MTNLQMSVVGGVERFLEVSTLWGFLGTYVANYKCIVFFRHLVELLNVVKPFELHVEKLSYKYCII